MPHLKFEQDMPYGAQFLYDLVMDAARYPEIFPDMIESITITREDPGRHKKSADVIVSWPYRFAYSCDIEGDPPQSIAIRATAGDFDSMNAKWRFEPMRDGRTKVSYSMDYDFGGMGFKNAASQFFIESSMKRALAHVKEYAERRQQTLRQPGPRPPAMGRGPA